MPIECCWLDMYEDLIGDEEFDDEDDDDVPVVLFVPVPIDESIEDEKRGWNAAAAAYAAWWDWW